MLAARRLSTPFINWYNIAIGALLLAALATVPVAAPLDAVRRLFIAGEGHHIAAWRDPVLGRRCQGQRW